MACLGEEYPLDIPESIRDIHLSTQLAPFFFLFSTDIPRNPPRLVRAFGVLANLEIFPRIFQEISMENDV